MATEEFDTGVETPILKHSNPVISRALHAAERGESLVVLYDAVRSPDGAPIIFVKRKIKPIEAFTTSSWPGGHIYIRAISESETEAKIFRADRMALMKRDGMIYIGRDAPCSSKHCSNQVQVKLNRSGGPVLSNFCTRCLLVQAGARMIQGTRSRPPTVLRKKSIDTTSYNKHRVLVKNERVGQNQVRREPPIRFMDTKRIGSAMLRPSTIGLRNNTMAYNKHKAFKKDERVNHTFMLERFKELQDDLLDLTRRNKLINFQHPARGAYFLRVVDEVPDELLKRLLEGAMRFASIPDIDKEPEDEKTDGFQAMLKRMKKSDQAYIQILEDEEMKKTASIGYQKLVHEAERELRNGIREKMGLPRICNGSKPNLPAYAIAHGIDPKFALPRELTKKEHKDDIIQSLLLPDELTTRLRRLYQKSQDFIKETGINVLAISFGFLEWPEPSSNEKSNMSPLLLLPIVMERKKTNKGYEYFLRGEGDIEVNQTLLEKIKSGGIKLPDFGGESLTEYFDEVSRALQDLPLWQVHRYVTLGIFNFQSISIYKDLFPELWDSNLVNQEISSHDIVSRLLGGKEPREKEFIEVTEKIDELTKKGKAPPLILDADSSQHSAIYETFNEMPLVIQGPPGTGKSQTIANLIAASVASGKKVLFIAQKKPALDVVAAKLKSARLGPLLLEPTPKGAGAKKEFLDSLSVCLDASRTIEPEYDDREYRAKKRELIKRIKFTGELKLLLTDTTNFCELSFFDLVWKYIRIRHIVPKKLRDSIGTPPVDRVSSKILDDGKNLIARWFELDVNNAKFADLGGFTNVSPLTTLIEQFQNEVKELLDSIKELRPILDQVSPNAQIDLLVQSFKAVRSLTQNGLKLLTGEQLNHEYGYLRDEGDLDLTHKKLKETLKIAERLSIEEQDRFDNLIQELSIEGANEAQIERLIENSKSTLMSLKILAQFAKSTHSEALPAFKIINLIEMTKTVDVKSLVDNLNTGVELNDEQFLPNLNATIGELEDVQSETERLKLKIPVEEVWSLDLRKIKNHIASIEKAGLLRIFSPGYIRAKKFVNRVGIELDDKEEIVKLLRKLAMILEKAVALNTNKRMRRLLGGTFNGVQSDISPLVKMKRDLETLKPLFMELKVDWKMLVLALGELASMEYEEISENIDERKNCDQLCLDRSELIEDLLEIKELADRVGLLGQESIWNPSFVELKTNLISRFPELKNYTNWKLLRESERPIEDAQRRHASRTRITDYSYDQLRECTEVKSKVTKILSNVDVESAEKFQNTVNQLSELVSIDSLHRRIEKFIEQYYQERKDASPELRISSIGDVTELAVTLEKILGFDSSDIKRSIMKAGFDEDLRKYWWSDFFSRSDLFNEFGEITVYDAFEFALIRKIIQKFASDHSTKLGQLTSATILNNVDEFIQINEELKSLETKRTLHMGLPKRGTIPRGSNYGPKKTWTNLSLIENEIGKQKRHISIRQLILRAQDALLAMKPVWLMDPVAVSRYLPRQRELFDLVVIDEASQMLPGSAIAGVARGRQLVVVGDDQQMPPSEIFKSLRDDDEHEIDSESILDLAKKRLGKTISLQWHYRSSHESLISFSNKNFYNDRLQVCPSPKGIKTGLGVSRIQVKGAYKKSLNIPEAKEVITQLKKCVVKYPKDSIGIVAMNKTQQDYINEQLNEMKYTDPIVSEYFERWEKNLLESPFVKNLENVQGDERDTIIISTVYGPEDSGRTKQNFPLINTDKGHRRLNVLFTRAKKRIFLVTSMRPSDIKLEQGIPSMGKKILRDYIEYAASGRLEVGENTGAQPENDFELSVVERLKIAGYEPVPQVGVGRYRIDIGVKHPDYHDGYIAGIEADGATYHSSPEARDRDKIRQDVLESQGWNIYRIWSTDWFDDPDKQTQKMLDWLKEKRTASLNSKVS